MSAAQGADRGPSAGLPAGGSRLDVPPDRVPAPAFRLLIVCTGNICRSAMAERLARRLLADLPGSAARAVEVRSAGTRAVSGAPVHPDSAMVLRTLGGDDEGFAARQLRPEMVREADLTLTMTREHRRIALELDPRAMSRTFTLREAADLLRLIEDGPAAQVGPVDGAVPPLVRRMAAMRSRRSGGELDDITDPINRPIEVHREVAAVISADLRTVLGGLAADLRRRERTAAEAPEVTWVGRPT